LGRYAGRASGWTGTGILTAIVETFIASGEPVGSRTLARSSREGAECGHHPERDGRLGRCGISGAARTLRGTGADGGGLSLLCRAAERAKSISRHENQSIIQDTLTGVTDVAEFMERTSHVLSLISHSVGITVAHGGAAELRWSMFTFRGLSEQKVLAVVVTRFGSGRDRVLRLDIPQPIWTWRRVYINENFRGWTMADMRAELARRPGTGTQRVRPADAVHRAALSAGALASTDETQAVFVEGRANLVDRRGRSRAVANMLRTL